MLVRGNVPASVVLPANGPISAVENLMVDITTQNDKNNILLGHIAKNLSEWHTGDPNIFGTVTTAIDGDKYAEVELEPAVARIEFEGLQTTTVTAITGFDLKGIYQNNFFTKLKMGDGSSDDKKDYGINPANYALGQGLFTGINKEKLFDEFTPVYSATGSPLAVSPAGGADKRWVYHIYENGATDANDQLQLIFKLENLQPSATIPSPQFLTVRGFKNSSGQLVEIQKGKIYTVSKSDFTFNESNLTTVPNTNAVGVWLKVTVKPWEVVNVKPNL
ncbi:hypothetical protein AB9N12_08040 [Bacteroides sp. AN502(2024)]|uniref:hypothetical protein n=1 Tax=Bacteroides sp. AN502(2024) TaxID=3160599 RepID=UPI003512F883